MNEYEVGFQTALDEFEKHAGEHGVGDTREAVMGLEFDLSDEFEKGQYEAFSKIANLSVEEIEAAIFPEEVSAFEMGKTAALADLGEMIEAGANIAECFEVVGSTLSQDLEKIASEEDVNVRLGVEAICWGFLEKAAHTFMYGDEEIEKVAMGGMLGSQSKLPKTGDPAPQGSKKEPSMAKLRSAGEVNQYPVGSESYKSTQTDGGSGGGSLGKSAQDEKILEALQMLQEQGLLDTNEEN